VLVREFEVAMGESGYQEFMAAMNQGNAYEIVNNHRCEQEPGIQTSRQEIISHTEEREFTGEMTQVNAFILALV
jgi:hypothetical protein